MKSPRPLLFALIALGFAVQGLAAAPSITNVTATPYSAADKNPNTGFSLAGRAVLTAQVTAAQADTQVTFFFSPDQATAQSAAPSVPHVTANVQGGTAQHIIPTQPQISDGVTLKHDPSVTYYVHAVATGGATSETSFQENVAPTANPVSAHAEKLTPVTIHITEADPNVEGSTAPASDRDGDPLVVTVAAQPTHGSAVVDAGGKSITYTPNATYNGTDSFSYTVTDNFGATATATVTIGNRAPTAAPIKQYAKAGPTLGATATTIYITEKDPNKPNAKAPAQDPDGDLLIISAPAKTTHGKTVVKPTTIEYMPDADSVGDDSFSYTVTDPFGATATATITITNNPPKAVDDLLTVARDKPTLLAVLANDTDEEPGQLEITDPKKLDPTKPTDQPRHVDGGTIQTVGQPGHEQILFKPDASFTGVTEFAYTIADAYGKTATGTVHLVSAQALMNRSAGIPLKDASGRIAGYIRLDSFPNGSFSARIEIGSKKYRLIGSFDANGNFTGVAHDEDGGFLPLTLGFGFDDKGAPIISANLGAGTYTSDQALATISAAELATLKGRYTVELPAGGGTTTTPGDTTTTTGSTTTPTTSDTTATTDTGTTTTTTTGSGPEGTGWMTIKVDEDGDASIKGKTGDGRSFSARGVVGGSDDTPELVIFATPHSGTLAGTLKFGETISGSLQWTRGETDATFYPEGFDLALSASGGRYERPDDGKRALASDSSDAGRGTLTVSGGNIDGFTRQLRFSEDDKVEVLDKGEEDSGVKIHRKSGVFSGAFSDPDDENHHIHFDGVLIQSTGTGSGVFQGRDKAGTVKLSITTETTTPTDSGGTTTQTVRGRR